MCLTQAKDEAATFKSNPRVNETKQPRKKMQRPTENNERWAKSSENRWQKNMLHNQRHEKNAGKTQTQARKM